MDHHYVCGQSVQRLGEFAKWPGNSPRLPWNFDLSGYRGTLTPAQLIEAFRLAFSWWAEAAEMVPVMVPTPGEALIRSHFARIDGANGILAWSELADNTNQPKTQRYDNSELWNVDWFLPAVIAHELGHMLGLEHDGQSSEALMAPFINKNVPKPTPRDIQRLLSLGYVKRTTPLPGPDPLPGNPPEPYTVRFTRQFAAGSHDGFMLGSKMEVGDYLMTRIDPVPPQ